MDNDTKKEFTKAFNALYILLVIILVLLIQIGSNLKIFFWQ